MNDMKTETNKTIADLEDASNAAHAAHAASDDALGAMQDLRRALVKAEDEALDGALPEAVKEMFRNIGVSSLIVNLDARIEAEKKENERLYDVYSAAIRALNDAPEEAA